MQEREVLESEIKERKRKKRKEKKMERKGKAEEKELMVMKKLKRGFLVGKRAAPSTPSPTWKLHLSSSPSPPNTTKVSVSARQLCASLWDIHPHPPPHLLMNKKLAKLRHHPPNNNQTFHLDPPNTPPTPHQVESRSSLRRHAAASLVHHHQSNGCSLQPVSPTSDGSSMELTHYNPAVTHSSSLEFNSRTAKSSYSLKTSTELLKVLNRIWSLEEQHASNMSLVKALKMELDHCQARIKELLREKQKDRQGMDDLMQQVAEEKVVRKNKELDRIKAVIESMRDELEDERRLRRHSENLHRKLARELSETKASFANELKELERERKARILLENLCDEFAKGIREYEQEVRALKHKYQTDHTGREDSDRLILHISEAWLDERLQMKLAEGQSDITEYNTIVDKLSLDIETFLCSKRSIHPHEKRKSCSVRHSVESFPLNGTISAPHDLADEEDYIHSDYQSASGRRSKNSSKQQDVITSEGHLEELINSNSIKKKVRSKEVTRIHNLSGLEPVFDEHAARGNTKSNDSEWNDPREENCGAAQEDLYKNKTKPVEICVSSPNQVLDHLIRNQSLSSEGDKVHPEIDLRGDSCVRASPLQQWISKRTSSDFDNAESASRLPHSIQKDTLHAKLIEARLEGRYHCSRRAKAFF
ncbi:uncharacterized protein At5g41620 [Carica papaya]|uniref:uncharacterized protein At5g41620 n=1 Tax=Carica papaya TaxID=3649 RepID=UPI000B8D0BC5|nr:uncharacterized protein At5g41620 [Carica papaya]